MLQSCISPAISQTSPFTTNTNALLTCLDNKKVLTFFFFFFFIYLFYLFFAYANISESQIVGWTKETDASNNYV